MSQRILHLGIAGAGQMGTGIALTAVRGLRLNVSLYDTSRTQLEKSQSFMQSWYSKESLKKSLPTDLLSKVQLTDDLSSLQSCDFVIECIAENLAWKLSLVKSLSEVLTPDTVFASNTSSLSITHLASASCNPSKFLGMHFFYPVPVMKLVEVIPGLQTDPHALQRAKDLAGLLEKTIVEVQDRPCFLVNRVLIMLINEAIHVLAEGGATAEAIDTTFKIGLNHPMGPLQLADFVGLDTCLEVMRSLHKGLGDCKYRPSSLLARYVDAGWLGKKTGRGFYQYQK